MNDDLNSPILIAKLFEGMRIINLLKDKAGNLTYKDIELLNVFFQPFLKGK